MGKVTINEAVYDLVNSLHQNSGNVLWRLMDKIRDILTNNGVDRDNLIQHGHRPVFFHLDIMKHDAATIAAIINQIGALTKQLQMVCTAFDREQEGALHPLTENWTYLPYLHDIPGLRDLMSLAGSETGRSAMDQLKDSFDYYAQTVNEILKRLQDLEDNGQTARDLYKALEKLKISGNPPDVNIDDPSDFT